MKTFKLYISNFFVMLVAIQILNLSIDVQNFQPAAPKNTLYLVNEMNSIVEFVTEKLITKKDTFPESKHHNNNGAQTHKHTTVSTCFPVERLVVKAKNSPGITHAPFLPVTYNFIYTKIQSPPPKFC